MKFLILSLLILASCFIIVATAQNQQSLTAWKNNSRVSSPVNTGGSGTVSIANSSSGQFNVYFSPGEEGNPLLYDEWKEGIIYLKDETVLKGRKYRYNIYNQQMEFIYQNDTAAIANSEDIQKITIAKHTFVYRPFVCQNTIHHGYLEKLYEGEYCLLLHRFIKYEMVEENTDPLTQAPVHKYYRDDTFYYTDNTGPAKPFPVKKKQILELFNDPSKDIKSFLKISKNKLRSKDDFIRLFEYYFNDS